jgi:hypothetical protein
MFKGGGSYRISREFPFKATVREWKLMECTVELMLRERKDRYNEILRARVYRKYLWVVAQ